MKLNIGCDTLLLPKEHGWINIDHRNACEGITLLDVRNGLAFQTESIDEIYCGNFFDHLSLFEGLNFLEESKRVLKTGCSIKLSLMDTDKIINDYLYDKLSQYDCIQPIEYRYMQDKSLKFATFLLGNMAKGEKEYSGHKMLYTPASIKEVASQIGLKTKYHIQPNFNEEPWTVSNKEHQSHCFYVELIK